MITMDFIPDHSMSILGCLWNTWMPLNVQNSNLSLLPKETSLDVKEGVVVVGVMACLVRRTAEQTSLSLYLRFESLFLEPDELTRHRLHSSFSTLSLLLSLTSSHSVQREHSEGGE